MPASRSSIRWSGAGWPHWGEDEEVELSIASSDQLITSVLTADPFHALATEEIKAASFKLARPASSSPQTVSLSTDGRSFFSRRLAPNRAETDVPLPRPVPSPKGYEALPTVIIPVYDDVDATKACLDSILADPDCGRDFRLLIIDDASPDPTIANHLRSLFRLPLRPGHRQ